MKHLLAIFWEVADVVSIAAAACCPLLALAMTETPARDWRWIVIAIWFVLSVRGYFVLYQLNCGDDE